MPDSVACVFRARARSGSPSVLLPFVAGPRLPPAFTHLLADYAGVPAVQLTDRALVGGLLIAAAGAAGLSAIAGEGTPLVRTLPTGGIAAALLLGSCHIIVHTRPDEGVLLLDVLAPHAGDPRKAADVFTRRLGARTVHLAEHGRG